jgi:hypothetical protein
MTDEDYRYIIETFKSGGKVNEAFSQQFDALEKLVYVQKEFIENLEKRILVLESRNRVYR